MTRRHFELFKMLPLKNKKEKQNDLKNNLKSESELEKWEDEQLEIFSDIILFILSKSNLKINKDEK